MRMLMVPIVMTVRVFVLRHFMLMPVTVRLYQVQNYAGEHQRRCILSSAQEYAFPVRSSGVLSEAISAQIKE